MTRFNFNGRWCRDFGIYVSGNGTYNAPERDVTAYEIPGRNGDLIISNERFKNTKLTYPAFIHTAFPYFSEMARQWLLEPQGYCILFDDYHPHEFRKARFEGPLDFDVQFMNRSANVNLIFDCKPQRYLFRDSGGIDLDDDGSVLNPTNFDASPLIRAYGTGNGVITVAGTTFTLTGMQEYIDIDSELQDAYKGLQNENAKMTGSFPKLKPGVNSISFSGDVTAIRIYPRWWII